MIDQSLQAKFDAITKVDGMYVSGRFNSKDGKQLRHQLHLAAEKLQIDFDVLLTCLRYGLNKPPVCRCGTLLRPHNGKFLQYCSPSCSAKSEQTKALRAATNLQKYGTEFATQSEEVQRKTAKTNFQKYGTASSWANADVRKKAEATNILKFGTRNAAKSDIIRKKIQQTHAARTKEEKHQTLKKTQSTCLAKYGEISHMKTLNFSRRFSAVLKQQYAENELSGALQQLREVHGHVALFNIEDWRGCEETYKWRHEECGREFSSRPYFSRGFICPFCRKKSKVQETVETLVSHSFEPENRTVISPYEIDIWVPEKKIGIEVNGTYWHHDMSPNLPLLQKTLLAEEQGIQLLHFWDFEILEHPEIVRSIISAKLGKSQRVYARKLELRKVKSKEASDFFTINHLQGKARASFVYGLYQNNTLMMAVSIGKPRFSKHADFEIIRVATKLGYLVVGGLSKLLNHIRQRHVGTLLTYADRRISTGNAYRKLGAKELEPSEPGYFWVKGNLRVSRYSAQKHRLVHILGDKFDASKSEAENMYAAGFYRCYDSGNRRFIFPPINENV